MRAAWAGARSGDITGMRAAIYSLTGTPQDPVTWSDPDQWIPERLSGADRDWALKTWVGSHRKVNPRHCGGHWLLISNYGLLEEGPEGRLSIGDRGRHVDRRLTLREGQWWRFGTWRADGFQGEGRLPSDHLEQDHAERIHVARGARRGSSAARLIQAGP